MDIPKLRAETASCRDIVHFNNAGASPTPEPVHAAVLAHLELERLVGGYAAAQTAAERLTAFYMEAAGLIGADPEDIAFVENATRAWQMAFYAIPFAPGDRVLAHVSEYGSNYMALLHRARTHGIIVEWIPSAPTGGVDVAALGKMITSRTRLIALTHVPSHSGVVNPAAAVGEVARQHGIPFILDACQSIGQIDLDVDSLGCDMLCATGRKFLRGPRGTGFLYVRKDVISSLDPPFIDLQAARWTATNEYCLHPTAQRFETWERNVAGQLGLAEAIRYARNIGLARIEARNAELAQSLRVSLLGLPGVRLDETGERLCGIVTFRLSEEDPAVTAVRLRQSGIMVSVVSRAQARLDFEARNLESLVRVSIHYFNDADDITRFMTVLADRSP